MSYGSRNKDIDLETGWDIIQSGIDKVVSFVETGGLHRGEDIGTVMTPAEMMEVYDVAYHLYCNKRQYDHKLYSRYEAFFQNLVNTKVLPAVRAKSGELFLREVAKCWRDYKFIALRVSRFFHCMDSFYITRCNKPTMHNTALLILRNMVYEEKKGQIISTVMSLINEDREGNSIDHALIKIVLEIVYDLQSKTLSVPYQIDFEPALLDSSCDYYLNKVEKWFQNLQCDEYMSKVDECLNAEKLRVMRYLHWSTVTKLLESLHYKLRIRDGSDVSCLSSKVEQLELENKNDVLTDEWVMISDEDYGSLK